MSKLDDIPKKNLFEVPDGYFDKLPGVIQARLSEGKAEEAPVGYGQMALRFAIPVVVIMTVGWFYFSNAPTSAEEVLAGIDSEQLVAILQESELTTDDLLESIPLDQDEADAIEENAMLDMELTDLDIEELENEFELSTDN